MYYRVTAILQLSSRRLHRFPVTAYCTFRYSIVLVIAYFSNVFTVIAIILNLPVFRILILINQLPCKTRLICVNSRKIPILLVLRATFAIISAAHCYTAFSSSQWHKGMIFCQLEEDQQSLKHESPSANVVDLPSSGIEWRWARSTKARIPTRSYFKEIATTIFVPVILLLVLGALLSTALCLHHEKM